MANMGTYCKGYYLRELRAFPNWREKTLDKSLNTSNEAGVLRDEDYAFLQENFNVTRGIFIDENILFDEVTEEWKIFAEKTLQFRPFLIGD